MLKKSTYLLVKGKSEILGRKKSIFSWVPLFSNDIFSYSIISNVLFLLLAGSDAMS